jgi:hypothetical protein
MRGEGPGSRAQLRQVPSSCAVIWSRSASLWARKAVWTSSGTECAAKTFRSSCSLRANWPPMMR